METFLPRVVGQPSKRSIFPPLSFRLNGTHSEQLPKLSDCKASVLHDIAHRERIDRVMPWYGNEPDAVGHYNMPSPANSPESRFFERPDARRWLMAGRCGIA